MRAQRPRRAATRPAATRSRPSRSRWRRARRRASSAPTAAARRRCSARCSASCPQRRGTVELAGRPAYVPQTDHARLDFPVSALDVALMGAYRRTPFYRRLGRGERAAAEAALERVGLADRARARFGTLSGGQRQRVLIARALVQDARVLLLDEPLSGVDAPSAARIEAVLRELRDEGRALLVATHDVEQARRFERVLCLHRRQVAFGAPAEVLERAPCCRRPTATSSSCSRAGARPSTSAITTTDAGLADRPVPERLHAAGAARGARAGARLRAARRLDPALPPELRGRVDLPRHAARARARRAGGGAARARRGRRACCSRPPRSRSPGATSASAATPASRSRSRRCSGSARCSRSRPRRRRGCRSCCSATCSGRAAGTSRRRRSWRWS